jgi:CheY-like chemotaxis protein
LLIDDNRIDNYISDAVLKKSVNCSRITCCSGAKEALEFLKSLNGDFPNMIFLDIRMPEIDGFGFLEAYAVWAQSLKISCKIFMLTSSADAGDKTRAAAFKCVKGYLNKPLSPEKVAQVLANSN